MTKILPLNRPIFRYIDPPYDNRVVCKFKTQNDILGEMTTDTRIYQDGLRRFISEIKNPQGKILGFELYFMQLKNKLMRGQMIEILPEYRHSDKKDFRFGEILRLNSIIEMVENGIEQFEIFSKNTAIYFHSKYKFSPDIKSTYDLQQILETIKKTKTPKLATFAFKADGLLKRLAQTPSSDELKAIKQEANELTKNFIRRAIETNTQTDNKFLHGFDMKLDRENVMNNRDFYNELFAKHNIDYKI